MITNVVHNTPHKIVPNNSNCTWYVNWCWDHTGYSSAQITAMAFLLSTFPSQERIQNRLQYWGSTPPCRHDTCELHTMFTVTKERASGGHFILRAFPKMAAETASNFVRSSNFCRMQAKSAYFLLNFEKWELNSLTRSQSFLRFMVL